MAVDAPAPQWVKHLPRSLNSLHLHNVDNLRLADLPALLTHFRLTAWWPASGSFDHKDWRPEYLAYLRVERWNPVPQDFLNHLPRTVTNLVLKTDKPTVISKLPDSVTRLRLPAQATFSSHKWPSGLTSLKVSRLTNFTSDALVDLPKTVTFLSLSCPAGSSTAVADYFKEMPRTIKHLTIWNRKLDSSIFVGLKDSQLETLEIFTGESKDELLAVDMPSFRWSLLENLPPTLTKLRLPIAAQKFEIGSNFKLGNLVDLSLPHVLIEFETLQMLLLHYPNLRRATSKQFKFEPHEAEAARQLIQSNPLVSLQSIKASCISNSASNRR